MKKPFILISIAVTAALLFCSCDVHEFPYTEEPEPPAPERPQIEVEISLDATDWPELTTIDWGHDNNSQRNRVRGGSRADDHKMRFTLNIYSDNTDARYPSRNLQAVKILVTDLPVSLDKVRERVGVDLPPGDFVAMVWVDYVDAMTPAVDLYYNTTDFSAISILGDDHPGNCTQREAFRGATRFTVTAEGNIIDLESRAQIETVPVVAQRPMARYEFITTDLDDFIKQNISPASQSADDTSSKAPIAPDPDDYTVHIRYTSYMPTTYNCHTDRPVDAKTGVSYYGRIVKKSEKEATLGFDHVFVNGSETTVQVALDVYSSSTGNLLASSDPISVPLKRNHNTYIKGKFLTTKANGGAGINPGFYGDDYNIIIK